MSSSDMRPGRPEINACSSTSEDTRKSAEIINEVNQKKKKKKGT